jgi:hypothetical protein
MILEDFYNRLVNSYRHKDDSVNETFRADLNDFCDRVGQSSDYQGVYDHVMLTHKYHSPPKMFLFYQYAKDNSMMKQTYEKFNGFWKCNTCNTKYSYHSGACPKCGSTNGGVIKWDSDEAFPADFDAVKENCFQCTKYKPDKRSAGFRVYGCTCADFGKHYLKTVDQQCSDCVCRPCCVMAAREKYDEKYLEDLKKGKIKMEWLI